MKTGPLLTVNEISLTPVRALTVCRNITVEEDASVTDAPTSNFKVYVPTASDGPWTKFAGVPHLFQKPLGRYFEPGELAGYLELVAGGGSTFFTQYED